MSLLYGTLVTGFVTGAWFVWQPQVAGRAWPWMVVIGLLLTFVYWTTTYGKRT
jgi:hypothetical protein